MSESLTHWLSRERLDVLLDRAHLCRVGVVGDLALDGYWTADMTRALLSRETPRFPRPVVTERYAPGAGGNVAQNLSALGVARVEVLSILGDDWRGVLLRQEMAARGIGVERLITSCRRSTTAYIKPLLTGYESQQEDSRLDFENAEPLAPALEEALIARLAAAIGELDALFVADQFEINGIVTGRVREALVRLAAENLDKVFVADSRCRIGEFRGMVVKPNRAEAAEAALTPGPSPGGRGEVALSPSSIRVGRGEAALTPGPSPGGRGEVALSPSSIRVGRGEAALTPGPSPGGRGEAALTPSPIPGGRGEAALTPGPSPGGRGGAEAEALAHMMGGPVVLTLSGEGALVWVDGGATHIPAAPVTPPLDTVGAGDTFGAALMVALACGATLFEASALANLAAAVTVEKLGQTGTATPDEIVARYRRLQNLPGG